MSSYNNISQDFYNSVNNIGSNPTVLVILISIVLVYYVIFSFLGTSNTFTSDNSNTGLILLQSLLWGIIILLVLVNGISYFFNINIITELQNIFEEKPKINIKSITDISNTNININNKETYHIPGNRFTYNDAKAVCKAYDGELATYNQVADSQQKGASWCSYGWTKKQLGLYPTSQDDWLKLQEKEGHEYDCGIPGVNGGYVANPYIPLGANCYGVKPKQSELEKEYLSDKSLYPKTQKEYLFDERVKYWKNRIGNVLISPFNNNKWYK
jgi:hypothetical protein